ncbi:MAG TPA: Holliday junction resolvase RuvX [Steroidobacteraceae bacterium]|jgi:putative Holliday junction resolvase|nr:Holliday junction resolvase RuvX [Steroidobacteraceae bacterium]
MPERGPAPPVSTILALDFGLRRIGVASGDTLTRSARPRGAIGNGPSGPDWAALRKHLDDVRPARLAIGEPYNADGSASPLTEKARRFAAELHQRCSLPVDLVDERWSSQDAEERLRAARASGLKVRRVSAADVDATAAAVILERWFETH